MPLIPLHNQGVYIYYITSCHCLYWMDVKWLVASCHIAWDDRDVVDCAGLKWGQVKWCNAFQCELVHLSYWPIVIWRNINIIPLREPHYWQFLYWDSQQYSVNCGVNSWAFWWTCKVYGDNRKLHKFIYKVTTTTTTTDTVQIAIGLPRVL